MILNDLEIVTYDEAAAMLGVVKGTITVAVNRGALTALPRLRRKPGRLAKQQVALFVGKELSLANLTHEQTVIWYEVNRVVNAHKLHPVAAANSTLIIERVDAMEDNLSKFGDILKDMGSIITDTFNKKQPLERGHL